MGRKRGDRRWGVREEGKRGGTRTGIMVLLVPHRVAGDVLLLLLGLLLLGLEHLFEELELGGCKGGEGEEEEGDGEVVVVHFGEGALRNEGGGLVRERDEDGGWGGFVGEEEEDSVRGGFAWGASG